MRKLTVGSLFSGVGGFELGLEMTGGFTVIWQVEIKAHAQEILAERWPDVTRYGDIRGVGKHNLAIPDVLVGGFPCQDISDAGAAIGISGKNSGLWREFYRVIRELRPQYVLVENVAALLHRGADRVLGDLCEIGYDAEWSVISACSVGAPHTRERVFILAYPGRDDGDGRLPDRDGAAHTGWAAQTPKWGDDWQKPQVGPEIDTRLRTDWWGAESVLDRMAPRIPHRVDRLGELGNSIVPAVAAIAGQRLLSHYLACLCEQEGVR